MRDATLVLAGIIQECMEIIGMDKDADPLELPANLRERIFIGNTFVANHDFTKTGILEESAED